MKAPQSLISTIRQVRRPERLAAAKLAERTYFAALEKLEAFGDFSHQEHEQMAAEAAAAEVRFHFA